MITYRTTDSPKVIEFLIDAIVLGDITYSKGKFEVTNYYGSLKFNKKKEGFDTIEEAKARVSEHVREYVLGIDSYKEELHVPRLKEIIYLMAKRIGNFSWFELDLPWFHEDTIVGIVKELMENVCPKCGKNDILNVAENIVWCDNCEEHVEVELKKEAA